jgi:hypothetical protein
LTIDDFRLIRAEDPKGFGGRSVFESMDMMDGDFDYKEQSKTFGIWPIKQGIGGARGGS